MYENGRYHNGDGAKGIGENVEKDPVHVLIVMRMIMAMVMSVVRMVECHDTHKIHSEAGSTDHQELSDTVHLAAR